MWSFFYQKTLYLVIDIGKLSLDNYGCFSYEYGVVSIQFTMLTTLRPTIQKSSSNSDQIEYYNFFIDASAGITRLSDIYIDHYNRVIDFLIQESSSKEIYGSLETFTTTSKPIVKLADLRTEGQNLKLQPESLMDPSKLAQKRFLYFAIRTQLAHLTLIQRSIPQSDRAQVKMHGFLFTSGFDEQRESSQTWVTQKLLERFLLRNIGFTIIVHDMYRSTIQQDLQCPENIFYTGK
jgi:hypothetical protein